MINNICGGVIIRSEGYAMFHGIMRIIRPSAPRPFDIMGDWLFRPDTECWYCNGASYPQQICVPIVSATTIRED